MAEAFVTVTGNVVNTPVLRSTKDGTMVTNFRLASTPRTRDRATGEWRDGETFFVGVACWRSLADNVVASVRIGDPVIVSGRLYVRRYQGKDGEDRFSQEIEATAVGPDLNRGISRMYRPSRPPAGGEPARGADDVAAAERGDTRQDGGPGVEAPAA